MASVFQFMGEKVSAYSSVYSLTSDDPDMPGASSIKELADSTMSSVDACNTIFELLCDRAESDSSFVRLKALRIMKFLCQKGRPEFKIQLQRKNDCVRNCLQFRGALDPLRGDSVNASVRDTSKELMAVMFEQNTEAASSKLSQGFGSNYTSPSAEQDSYKNNIYSTGVNGAKKMQGYGHRPEVSEEDESFVGQLTNSISSFFEESKERNKTSYRPSAYSGVSSQTYHANNSNQKYSQPVHPIVSQHVSSSASSGPKGVGGAWNTASPANTVKSSEENNGIGGLPENLSAYLMEQRVVEEFTAGVKTHPSADLVLKLGKSGNVRALLALFIVKLSASSWTVQLKSLIGLDTLLNGEHRELSQSVLKSEGKFIDILRDLTKSTNSSLKLKAEKVLSEFDSTFKISGVSTQSSVTDDVFGAPTKLPAKSDTDLLDLSVATTNPAVGGASSFAFLGTQAVESSSTSSFSFLGNESTVVKTNANSFDALLDSLPVTTQQQPDLFGGLAIKPADSSSTNNQSDLFGGLAVKSSGNLFDGMQPKQNQQSANVDLFLPPSNPESFDVLSSVSANTSNQFQNVPGYGNNISIPAQTSVYNQKSVHGQPSYPQTSFGNSYGLPAPQTSYGNLYGQPAPQASYGNSYGQPAYGKPAYGQTTFAQPNFVQPNQSYMARPNVGVNNSDPLSCLAQGPSAAKKKLNTDLEDQFSFVKLK